ncbi:guanylate-binding protein 4-like [Eptesicus fuscus]|uniref:guanylate-binding protein 4-like n=1 Tax=Eptesicus fuscus TaxID=29078 RepID=UPI0024042219|nr:guanylate-binding protein 4-like [Eptesicus fuscus]
MASEYTMKDPICLVENQNNQLMVNPTALEILDQISQPVVVVAIAGLYRTGKSYLMNRLAGQNHGFCLGSTVRSETKGIWMWCIPHPSKPDHTLVLLDTEGLGDVEKGDSKNDSWIFALAVLLSSMFVYNSMSSINHQALEQLHYVTELTKLIRTKSSPISGEGDDSAEFASFFPDFVWVVRDFTLELELDGRIISDDQYLENALKLAPGTRDKIQQANIPRECIRKFFPKRKCFTFDRPTNDKKLLHHMDGVSENQLECSFQEQSKNFCNYIFTAAKTKTLREGIIVTGNRLGTLGKAYVDAINSGAVPCLENAVTTLAELENSAAMQKAANHYSEQMAQRVSFPTDTLQELLDLHAACEKEALVIFMEHSIMDEKQGFQEKLMGIIEKKKEDFLLQNEDASGKYCQAQLKQLSETLMESISRGMFSVPNGYKLYLEAIDKLEQSYTQVPRKGVKAHEVLQNFKQSQAATKESILQADNMLTAGEKALAAEQAKTEAVERDQELLRQTLRETQQKMEAQEKSFMENIALLKEKMKTEKEKELENRRKMVEYVKNVEESLRNHQEKEMQHKIEVQRIKAESEATTRKILEEVQKRNEKRWEEKEKNYQEHVKRLEEMEKGRAEEARNANDKLQVFNSVIAIFTSAVQNQKHCLEARALCHFSSPITSRHCILLLLLPVTISRY